MFGLINFIFEKKKKKLFVFFHFVFIILKEHSECLFVLSSERKQKLKGELSSSSHACP